MFIGGKRCPLYIMQLYEPMKKTLNACKGMRGLATRESKIGEICVFLFAFPEISRTAFITQLNREVSPRVRSSDRMEEVCLLGTKRKWK